jgi:uncharacterized protein YukE
MAGTEIPGLPEVLAWAGRLGIDVTDTVRKAQMLMQTDPAAVRTGGGDLSTVASGLSTGQQDLHRTGTDVMAGWTGQAADAFGPHHTDLVDHVGDTAAASTDLAAHLEGVATVFEQSQHAVVSATGVTATALGMLRA